jgi:type II secretory pathway component GspD/PulD (secretin)
MKFASSFFAIPLALTLSSPTAWAQPTPTPIQLKPLSNEPITLHTTDDSKNIYLAIAKLAGFNVLFDPDYQSKHAQIDFTNVSLSDALRIVGQVTNTFYKPLTPDTIYVALNSRQKHVDLDPLYDQTFYLKNASQQADANEVVTALRNMLQPETKIYLLASQNAIAVRGTAEDLVRIQKLLNELDLPKKTYRLIYTVTDMDGAKPVGTHHFDIEAVSGQNTVFKQGSRVPVATGSYSPVASDTKAAGVQTQFTYLDVGMNFSSTLTAMGDTAMLNASVEQSSVAPEQSGVGAQDPIVRQTSLRGVFMLTPGKPAKIGSLDLPGTSHHIDIEAALEPLH